MTPIENFINDKRSAPLSFLNPISVKETKDWVSLSYLKRITEPTIIVEPYWNNLLLFTPLFIGGIVYTFYTYSKSVWNILPLVIALVLGAILIRMAIRDKKSPKIIAFADKEILTIKNRTYKWKDVVNAYIMTEHSKKLYISLLLEAKIGEIDEIPLNQLGISRKKMATIVEYYRNKY